MTDKKNDDLKLRIGELTERSDYGRGIARISAKDMKRLGILEGDVIEIEGKRKTVAIAVRAYPADVGLDIVRMDGLVRKNCNAGISDEVSIRKADVKEAKTVVIAPARKGIVVHMSGELFKRNILMRPLSKGDIIVPNPILRSRRENSFNMFEEFFGIDFILTPFGEEKFVVISADPKGHVRITKETEVEVLPQAKDVEVEEKIPEVTYEDLGGLHNEIQLVREMIELPLKHPELFERLGIDPPKGILLHGPPGTGKTLLAKAVANESGAKFFVINGPEIVSKWYGGSLPYDERILISDEGKTKFVKIGELVEKNDYTNKKVLVFDKNGKVKFSPIGGLILHPNAHKMMEIRTKSGRNIRATDCHSLFTLDGTKVVSVKTNELIPGKSYIAVPKTIPQSEDPTTRIDLLELLKEDDHGLVIRKPDMIKTAIKRIGLEKTAAILDMKEKYVYDICTKNIGVRISKFIQLMKEANIKIDPVNIEISSKFNPIPAVLEITNELAEFLGLWIAEGSYNYKGTISESMRISINEKEAAYVKPLCEKLFGTCTVYRKKDTEGTDIYINNRAFSAIIQLLGFDGDSHSKKIPELVFNLPKEKIAYFLKGCFSGDGSLYKNQRGAITVEYSTQSQSLANDLMYLMLHFGIVAKKYDVEQKDGLNLRVCFAGAENLEKFKHIGFSDSMKMQDIDNYIKSIKFTRTSQIPITGEVREFISHSLPEWKNSDTIGAGVVETMEFPELEAVAQSDIYWDVVDSIKEIECKDRYVYDVSVSPCENFVGGIGGIFAHNSEENLRKVFDQAEKESPSIIFIDEIDSITPKREEVKGEVERRMVSQLLTLLDGLKGRGRIIVIGATNIPNSIDPALRRPGRLDREIEIGVPTKQGRKEVLQIHTRGMPLAKDVDVSKIADITYGYVGADIAALCKEAAMYSLRRILPEIGTIKEDKPLPPEILKKLIVTADDFQNAMKMVHPSAMREVLMEIPNIKWSDIGGLEHVKNLLKESVEWPLKNPQSFKRLGIKPPKGILLYGPPGTGKTMLAKAVANESNANFIYIKAGELLSMWVGESERHVRDVFRRAKQVAPSIVFFDEIDALAPRRGLDQGSQATERVVSQMLAEMSGLEEMNDVIVISATNRPDILDPALLRPGRFDRQILVPTPDKEARLAIFKIMTEKTPLAGVDLEELAEQTEGYSGADIEAVVREAGLHALRKSIDADKITLHDFRKALEEVRPSVSEDMNKFYESMLRKKKAESVETVDYTG
ncbi:MAG: AAA family ATPase [Candidatus Aenigmarchaeota archaeon]|nr:AAA family ATPase [Candidatus Aenigmarchaeota archaeon]